MKIVVVIGSLERGGSERQIVEFVQAAHPAHAECVVICLDVEGALAGDARRNGARIVSLGLSSSRSGGVREVLALARTLRRERPDVVYAFLFWGYSLALPVSALVSPRALRVAARRSLPGTDVPRRRVFGALRPLADAATHVVIANSQAVRDAWASSTPRLETRLRVVVNGVAPAPERQRRRRAGDPLAIVCVANLIHYKGHDTLLDAAARIRSSVAWRLWLVGDGPERERIEAKIARLGLADRVDLLGLRDDADDILAGADMAVLASRTEGLPNAVMEAMAHGLPVVATDVGGVRELLDAGGGSVVPVDAPDELARALEALLDDAALRDRVGAVGRRTIAERYSIESMRDRTLAVLRDEQARR